MRGKIHVNRLLFRITDYVCDAGIVRLYAMHYGHLLCGSGTDGIYNMFMVCKWTKDTV